MTVTTTVNKAEQVQSVHTDPDSVNRLSDDRLPANSHSSGDGTRKATPTDTPRELQARSTDDLLSLVGSVCASLALVWVLYEHVLAWSGSMGFIACWWLGFVAMYAALIALSNPR